MWSVLARREDAIQQQTVVEIVDERMRLLGKNRLSILNVAPIPIPQPGNQDSPLTLREMPKEGRELLLALFRSSK